MATVASQPTRQSDRPRVVYKFRQYLVYDEERLYYVVDKTKDGKLIQVEDCSTLVKTWIPADLHKFRIIRPSFSR